MAGTRAGAELPAGPLFVTRSARTKDVARIFALAQVQPPSPSSWSNAPLDPGTIAPLVESLIVPDPMVSLQEANILRNGTTRVLYSLAPTPKDKSTPVPYLLEISYCKDEMQARNHFQDALRGFQGDLEAAVEKPPYRLGDYALSFQRSLIWTRGPLFIDLSCDALPALDPIGSAPGSDGSTGAPAAGAGVSPLSASPGATMSVDTQLAPSSSAAGSSASVATDPIATTILGIATRLDSHIAINSVRARDLCTRVAPALSPDTPGTAKVGKTFQIQLQFVKDSHIAKPAEVDDPSIAVPTQNGTENGAYSFLALKAGRTKAWLMVAHARTLVMTAVEATIVVS